MGKKDGAIKPWLKNKKRFADLFNGMCFGGEQIIKPEELEAIDGELNFGFRDKKGIFKCVQRLQDMTMLWNGIYLLVQLGVEAQDKVHYTMPIKNMVMNSLSYVEQIRTVWENIPEDEKKQMIGSAEFFSQFRKEDKLYPVITLVLYTGEDWDGNVDLYGMFDLEDVKDNKVVMNALNKYVPNYHINLINPYDIDDITIFKTDLQMLMGVLQCSKDEDKLSNYVMSHADYFSNVDYDTANLYDEYLNISRLTTKKFAKKEGGNNVCKAMQDMHDNAVKEGHKEGIDKMSKLVTILLGENNNEALSRASQDEEYRDSLFEKYNI